MYTCIYIIKYNSSYYYFDSGSLWLAHHQNSETLGILCSLVPMLIFCTDFYFSKKENLNSHPFTWWLNVNDLQLHNGTQLIMDLYYFYIYMESTSKLIYSHSTLILYLVLISRCKLGRWNVLLFMSFFAMFGFKKENFIIFLIFMRTKKNRFSF